MKTAFLAALVGVVLACAPAQAAGNMRAKAARPDPAYQRGLELYAAGKSPQALGAFRLALRHRPNDRATQAAVRRLELELAYPAQPPRLDREPFWFDEWAVYDVPAFVNFDESLGDSIAAEGTLEASGGRVSQLLAERKVALAQGRPFPKDRELRALVRRLPALTA